MVKSTESSARMDASAGLESSNWILTGPVTPAFDKSIGTENVPGPPSPFAWTSNVPVASWSLFILKTEYSRVFSKGAIVTCPVTVTGHDTCPPPGGASTLITRSPPSGVPLEKLIMTSFPSWYRKLRLVGHAAQHT